VSEYGALASEVYDVAYPVGHSMNGDVEHYVDLLADIRGRVLEPAVGTGRVLVPLLQAGVDVDGYDLSPAMVSRCRDHCRIRGFDPRLEQADMTTYADPDAYAAVVVPAGSIVLLDGRAPTQNALTCFRESLASGGLLAVDVPAPQLLDAGTDELRTWDAGPTIWTLQTLGKEFDAVANQITHWLRYDRWDDGALTASELLRFRLQHWSLEEFASLLTGAGFTEITVTGDYAGKPQPGSGIWTFHARRG
jgi:SAM-dependent methyltransferase